MSSAFNFLEQHAGAGRVAARSVLGDQLTVCRHAMVPGENKVVQSTSLGKPAIAEILVGVAHACVALLVAGRQATCPALNAGWPWQIVNK